ncbi:hypothetical protein Lalb_Chr16g0385251 [Lupinus albus]|uniref:Uncharacterized protein n=1 Tax=Lupinus albus TaxID=3870 RepID=A0A6A4NUJ7_LUPAL|nr:hypothetical protein Lalb_Chr16g0385251 [Lupinus albus]
MSLLESARYYKLSFGSSSVRNEEVFFCVQEVGRNLGILVESERWLAWKCFR